ncbi:MAG: response regulator [Pirellulaceae bacterium]|jgi:DNA-binding response OmpR family regulator|nr:response regulator [Pirellulaceae bacterium]MDP7016722.1 response regulator [Pirellulaceae bacterium]
MGNDTVSTRKLSAFLADSSKSSRNELVESLTASGFVCRATGDYDEAAEILFDDNDFQVVFVNLDLDNGQGHHLVYKLLQFDDPPVIYFMASEVELMLGRMLLELGVSQIFYRPFDVDDLAKIATGAALRRRSSAAFRQERRKTRAGEAEFAVGQ